MRYLIVLILIVFFQQISFSQLNDRATNPKMLGELVFKSFQEENYETFLKYIFSEADCDRMSRNSNAPDNLKVAIAKQMKSLTNYIRQTSKENFENIISVGKDKKLEWKNVKLTDVKFDTKNQSNIQSSDIFLFCQHKEKIFLIKLDNCHKSDAWLMMDEAEIQFEE